MVAEQARVGFVLLPHDQWADGVVERWLVAKIRVFLIAAARTGGGNPSENSCVLILRESSFPSQLRLYVRDHQELRA